MTTQYAQIRSNPAAIFRQCRDALVEIMGWPEERVLVADPDQVQTDPHGDNYLILWVAEGTPQYPTWEGAGRVDFRIRMRMAVYLRTRYGVDDAPSSFEWLLDASYGHLTAMASVYDTLAGFQPTDSADDLTGATGNWLCTQPIEPAPLGQVRKIPKNPDWGQSVLGFLATFELAVNQVRQ